jgi:hypothetical protein
MVMSSWAQLAETIPEDQQEELAEALLDALAASTWCEVKVEIRDHSLYTVSLAKSKRFRHVPVTATKATCTA